MVVDLETKAEALILGGRNKNWREESAEVIIVIWSITKVSVPMAKCLDYMCVNTAWRLRLYLPGNPKSACLCLFGLTFPLLSGYFYFPYALLILLPAQFQHHESLVGIEQGNAICPHLRNKEKTAAQGRTNKPGHTDPGLFTPCHSKELFLLSSSQRQAE